MVRAVSARWNRSNTFGRSAGGIPEPWSRTVSVVPSMTTSIGPAVWSNLHALSMRFEIARSRPAGGAVDHRRRCTGHRDDVRGTDDARHDGPPPSPTRPGRGVPTVHPSTRPTATATSSLTSSVSSVTSTSRSSRISPRMSAGMSGWRRITDRFVRRLVSGVRSSWPASSHETLLLGAGTGERAEHPAERRPESAHLVAARYPARRHRGGRTSRRPRPPSSVAVSVRSRSRRSASPWPPRPTTPTRRG